MWQDIQAITNYRTTPPLCDSNASILDALNNYCTWFDVQNDVAARKTTPSPNDDVLCLTTADMKKTLMQSQRTEGCNLPGECSEDMHSS